MKNIIKYEHHSWLRSYIQRSILMVLCLSFYIGCAQVPKESVELSTTVGRDIDVVYQSHRELTIILYERIKNDVNKFVDEVYAPYQIKKLLQADHEDFKNNQESLFSALDAAVKQPDDQEAQKDAVDFMDIFVSTVRQEVESYRKERLKPILAQEKEVLLAIDRSYSQIHYANSIVTAHLASVVTVHDAQEELLNEFSIEDLRKKTGKNLSKTSKEVSEWLDEANKLDASIPDIEKKLKDLTEKLDNATKK